MYAAYVYHDMYKYMYRYCLIRLNICTNIVIKLRTGGVIQFLDYKNKTVVQQSNLHLNLQ